MAISKKNLGDRFDDFLKDEGMYEECTEAAIKRVLAMQLEDLMQQRHFTKSDMAKKMHTSRAALNRLLDPANEWFSRHIPQSNGSLPEDAMLLNGFICDCCRPFIPSPAYSPSCWLMLHMASRLSRANSSSGRPMSSHSLI